MIVSDHVALALSCEIIMETFISVVTSTASVNGRVKLRSALALLSVTSFASAASVYAQTSSLPETVVTATRTPSRIDDVIADTRVITREQLDRQTGRTLPEVLSQLPGVQFKAEGGPGQNSAVNLRGGTGNQVLLLIDGVRVGSLTDGGNPWRNTSLDSIERIEVVQGPLSGLYGSDALAGVIQIFTRAASGPNQGVQADARLAVNPEHAGQISTSIRGGQGGWRGGLSASQSYDRAFSATNSKSFSFEPDRDAFRQQSIGGNLGYQFQGGWRVDANARHTEADNYFDAGLDNSDPFAKLKNQQFSLRTQGQVLPGWRSSLQWAVARNENNVLRPSFFGLFASRQYQWIWENSLRSRFGEWLLVADHADQRVNTSGTPYDVSRRQVNGLALGLNGQAGAWRWQGNVRTDDNSQFGRFNSGSLGLAYDLSEQWRLGGSVGRSFTAPSFDQLYSPGLGNPNLRPERANTAEVFLRYAAAGQQIRLAAFERRVRDKFVSDPSTSFIPYNLARADIPGIQLSHDVQWQRATFGYSFEWLDPKAIKGSTDPEKDLQLIAKRSAKAYAQMSFTQQWTGGLQFSSYSDRFNDAENTQRLAGYGLLDLYVDYRASARWTAGARVNNVMDKRYENVLGYNQQGRALWLTLRTSL